MSYNRKRILAENTLTIRKKAVKVELETKTISDLNIDEALVISEGNRS